MDGQDRASDQDVCKYTVGLRRPEDGTLCIICIFLLLINFHLLRESCFRKSLSLIYIDSSLPSYYKYPFLTLPAFP